MFPYLAVGLALGGGVLVCVVAAAIILEYKEAYDETKKEQREKEPLRPLRPQSSSSGVQVPLGSLRRRNGGGGGSGVGVPEKRKSLSEEDPFRISSDNDRDGALALDLGDVEQRAQHAQEPDPFLEGPRAPSPLTPTLGARSRTPSFSSSTGSTAALFSPMSSPALVGRSGGELAPEAGSPKWDLIGHPTEEGRQGGASLESEGGWSSGMGSSEAEWDKMERSDSGLGEEAFPGAAAGVRSANALGLVGATALRSV